MLLRFTKMHGLGNDFMVLDLISQHLRVTDDLVRKWSDRNFGIGFDQLLIVEAPSAPDVDFKYRIFNADGSEVENCGNGARCFARFVYDKKLTGKKQVSVETANGRAILTIRDDGQVSVDMGEPVLVPEKIPFLASEQTAEYQVEVEGQMIGLGAVSMGNPHGVVLVDDVVTAPVNELGPLLESHPSFPKRANIGFLEICNRNSAKLRVFERGAGETLACGTGACAAVVSGILRGLLDDTVTVELPGGELEITWLGLGSSVLMTGPVANVFEGQIAV